MKRSTRDGSCAVHQDTSISLWILLCTAACAWLPPGDAHAVIAVLNGQFESVNVLDGEYQVGNNV